MIVGEASYELSEPTVDSQIISLRQGSGADTLIIGANPKAAAQAIRKAYEHRLVPGSVPLQRVLQALSQH